MTEIYERDDLKNHWYDLSEAEAAALLAERSWRTGEYEP